MVRVSSEVEVSDDEEVEPDTNSYDDSFIDDRINPTQASTQPETSGTDMMAIYRFLMNFYICIFCPLFICFLEYVCAYMFFLSLVIHIVFWKGIAEQEEPVSLVINLSYL